MNKSPVLLNKQADLIGAGTTALMALAEKLRVAALIAPAAVGASAGALTSLITSPSRSDVSNLQQVLYDAELEEALAYMNRKKDLSRFNTESLKGRKKEREIHI